MIATAEKKKRPRTRPMPEPQTFQLDDAALYVGVGISTFYRLLAERAAAGKPILPRKVPAVKEKRYLRSDLDQLLADLPVHPDVVGVSA